MPSSADEAFTQEDNRTINAGVDKKRNKKKKNNNKKTAYSIVHEEEREGARPSTGDLLWEASAPVQDPI